MKWIHNKSEVPSGPHFAIIEFSYIWIPGDERSRTNPGHGYPEHSESKCDYIVFECEGEWKNEVTKRASNPYGTNNWVAVRVTPASVSTTVNVSVT